MDNSIPLHGSPQDFSVKTKEMESLAKKKKIAGGGVVKARKPSEMVEQEKKKNWLRWLLAEEMVAKKNGLAVLAVQVLRQMVKKNEGVDKTG